MKCLLLGNKYYGGMGVSTFECFKMRVAIVLDLGIGLKLEIIFVKQRFKLKFFSCASFWVVESMLEWSNAMIGSIEVQQKWIQKKFIHLGF